MKLLLVIFAVMLLLLTASGRSAFAQQQLPQGIQRDQYDCYQQAQQAANLVRGHPNQQELIINLYYGCMKQKGYAVPAQQQPTQQPQQQPPVNRAVPPPAPRTQTAPQSSNQSGESAEDANNRANEFLLLLDPSLYTKD